MTVRRRGEWREEAEGESEKGRGRKRKQELSQSHSSKLTLEEVAAQNIISWFVGRVESPHWLI